MSAYYFALASPDTIRVTKEIGPWPEDRYKARREFETYAISLISGEPRYCYCPSGHRGYCKHLGWAKAWLEAGADPLRFIDNGAWSALPRPHILEQLCGIPIEQVYGSGGGGTLTGTSVATGPTSTELPTLTLEDLEL